MSATATDSDLQLLARYTHDRAEDAFAEIVRRHLDLVHSAALRQVRSPQLAEEVAQSAFTDLARDAARLKPDTILTAWLYQVTRRTAIDVVRREARRQLREQIATEMNAMNADSGTGFQPVWTDIEPLLDDAMAALDETDRAAVLLRYFENKSLREVGATLGTSDDAAQKRVSRAVERLREFFAKRGVTTGASGLVVVISANAVQAAPVGLAVTISTAAAIAGTTIAATATATAVKTTAMTTLQKTIIGATLTAAIGTGIYEVRQASHLRDEVQTLRQQQEPLTGEVGQLRAERDETLGKLTVLRLENERLRNQPTEVLRLRAEVSRLREETRELAQTKAITSAEAKGNDPFIQSVLSLAARAIELSQLVEQNPDKRIPEFQLLTENDWLEAAKKLSADSESDPRKLLNELRRMAKHKFFPASQRALDSYIKANHGQLPSDISELRPHFDPPLDDAILQRYRMANTGDASRFDWLRSGKPKPQDMDSSWVITEKGPPADKDDSIYKIGLGTSRD
jgi:RNA polymerase sigma factor (sigma-70 family)